MKLLIVLTIIASSFVTDARATSLEDALSTFDQRAPMVDAQLSLDDAVRSAGRTQADPFALRLDHLQAQQAVELAERNLVQARFDAFAQIAQAFTRLVEAERQLELAEAGRDLALRNLEIANIRLERGSATRLDVQDAETSAARAANDVATARQGRALAQENLSSLTGIEAPAPESVPSRLLAIRAPELDEVLGNLELHPAILQARHGLETAQLARGLLDPSYAARAQIDQAELQVERAREGLAEARRGLELQASQLHDATQRTVETVRVEREALADARERETLQRQRLDAGLIAEIVLDQARIGRMQAEVSALQAEHALLRALFDLQAGAVSAIEGLDDF